MTITGGQPELDEGDTFTATGSFTDPGADAWTATVDYGDGTGSQPLALNADKTFALEHTYLDNGDFTVTVRVFDGYEYGTATFDVEVDEPRAGRGRGGRSVGRRGRRARVRPRLVHRLRRQRRRPGRSR